MVLKKLYFEDATKAQLLQICLWEDCDIDYKYAAARELQIRQWREEYLTDLVKLWGHGKTYFEIAIELGLDANVVYWQIEKHGLYGKRVSNQRR